jgi:hypothetical protein
MELPGYPEFVEARSPAEVPENEIAAAKASIPSLAAST